MKAGCCVMAFACLGSYVIGNGVQVVLWRCFTYKKRQWWGNDSSVKK